MRVAETAIMAFRARERVNVVISKSRAEAKVQAKAGDGAGDKVQAKAGDREGYKGREYFREGGGISINKEGEKKVVVQGDGVKEEVRGAERSSLAAAKAAAPAVEAEETTGRRRRRRRSKR